MLPQVYRLAFKEKFKVTVKLICERLYYKTTLLVSFVFFLTILLPE